MKFELLQRGRPRLLLSFKQKRSYGHSSLGSSIDALRAEANRTQSTFVRKPMSSTNDQGQGYFSAYPIGDPCPPQKRNVLSLVERSRSLIPGAGSCEHSIATHFALRIGVRVIFPHTQSGLVCCLKKCYLAYERHFSSRTKMLLAKATMLLPPPELICYICNNYATSKL